MGGGVRSVLRRMARQGRATAAIAALTVVTSAFAVLLAITWQVTLGRAARADLSGLPGGFMSVAWPSGAAADSGAGATATKDAADAAVPSEVRALLASGHFSADTLTLSESLRVPPEAASSPNPLIKAVASPEIREHAVLAAGRWPNARAAVGEPVEAVLPVTVLAALGAHVGDTLALSGSGMDADRQVKVLIVGAYRRIGPSRFWGWDEVGERGVVRLGSFTVYDAAVVDASAFRTGPLPIGTAACVIVPDPRTADASATGLRRMAGEASAVRAALRADSGRRRFTVDGTVDDALNRLAAQVDATRSQLVADSLLLGIVAAAGLSAAAGLLAAFAADQAALSSSRGAGRRHVLATFWPEGAVLCVAAASGIPLGRVLAGSGSWTSRGEAQWLAAAAVGAFAMIVACGRMARPKLPGKLAVAAGRQSSTASGLRAGLDVALAVLAAIALWEARSGRPGQPGATATWIVAAAPALAVAAGAALAGRLVPLGARAAERAARRAGRLPTVFAGRQIARTPLVYVVPALVCVASVAGGVFAVTDHATWLRSTADQGAHQVGADVRVLLDSPPAPGEAGTLVGAAGVLAALPVVRIPEPGSQMIAVDSRTAPDVVKLRPDLSDEPLPQMWSRLAAADAESVPIPGQPGELHVTAAFTSGSGAGDRITARMTAYVRDTTGSVFGIDLGDLLGDGRSRTLTGVVSATHHAAYPIQLVGLRLSYPVPALMSQTSRLEVTGVPAPGVTPSWHGTEYSASEACGQNPTSLAAPKPVDGGMVLDFETGSLSGSCSTASFQGQIDLLVADTRGPVAGLATDAYLAATGARVGSTVSATVNGVTIPVKVTGRVTAFPTLPANDASALVVDQSALAYAVISRGSALPSAAEWWLHTLHAQAPAGLPPDATVTTATGAAAALTADPVSEAAQRVLLAGAAALLVIAALGLAACLVGTGRAQTAHEAVLTVLGAGGGQRLAIRCLRNGAVVMPGAALGVVLGLAVAWPLVPLFVLGADGSAPLPGVRLTTQAAWLLPAVLGPPAIALVTALADPARRSPSGRTFASEAA